MQNDSLYLDYAATAPISSIVQRNMYDSYEIFGNPATFYKEGEQAYQTIQKSKANILTNLGHSTDIWDILFTSGATESTNTVFSSFKPHLVITTGGEHEATVESSKSYTTLKLPISYRFGISVDRDQFTKMLRKIKVKTKEKLRILVSIIGVNNETGIIFPSRYISTIKDVLKEYNSEAEILVHVDFTQGFCKVPFDMSLVDCYSFSGHKIGFFKGFGGLIYKKGTIDQYLKTDPFIKGGGQQNKLRSGTENAQFVFLLDKLIENCMQNFDNNYQKAKMIQIAFINGLRYTFDHMGNTGNRCGYDMTGDDKQLDEYSPYIIRISFDNIEGESIVSALAEENVAIATGSACNSDSLLGSNVIRDYLTTSYNEIKDEDELQRYVNGTIRISYDHTLTIDQIQQFLVKLKKVLSFLLRTAAVHPLEKEK